jgi:uncharacterized protein (TIGR00299 family) protein
MSSLLFLEPIGGISGDLFLGAAADLGLDLGALESLLHGMGVAGFHLRLERAFENGIGGTRVTVELEQPGHHDHDAHGRSWNEIHKLLGHPALAPAVQHRARSIFERLAEVEGSIHGFATEQVHFHEIGATDSIVDIVGAAWAIEELGAPKIFTRPPPLGSGVATSKHGRIPIPAPATLALLRGLPVLLEGQGELTTPTGAALLAVCADFNPPFDLVVARIGYGIGHAHWADRPNLLRASLAERAAARSAVGLLEAHLDDATPELLGHLIELLMERGALDAGCSPLTMKKGRPGQRLTVVCRTADRRALSELILRESTTLGVRWSPVERDELERRHEPVETPYGPIRLKLGLRGSEVWNVAPEYEDCAAAARRYGVPLKEVTAAALAQYLRSS